MKRILAALAAVFTLLSLGAALEATPALAQVTGCTKSASNTAIYGRCTHTDGNPPYTTQFALMGQCYNSKFEKISITSGWKNVGITTYSVWCPSSYPNVWGSPYFLFR